MLLTAALLVGAVASAQGFLQTRPGVTAAALRASPGARCGAARPASPWRCPAELAADPRVGRRRPRSANAMQMQDMQQARPAALANPRFGDTGGAMLLVEGVSLSAGDRDIIVDANLKVNRGEVVGLVGQNGAGKSTLLSAIAGRRDLDGGKALVRPGTSVGYLVQTAVSGSQRTAWEEAASGMERVAAAEAELAAAEAAVVSGDGDAARAAERLAVAADAFDAVGAASKEVRIERVLGGLGFAREDHNRSCSDFSGGWQMRIALARLLLSEPELLLLDEPTNHLDLRAKQWLMGYLAQYEGTIVLVTHDEALLDAAKCTAIAEVRDRQVHYFRCGYGKFAVEREERNEAVQREQLEADGQSEGKEI